MAIRWALLAVVALVAGCDPGAGQGPSGTAPLSGNLQPFQLLRIVDGDTVWARDAKTGQTVKLRLMGFDTPETYKPGCAQEYALGMRAKARLAAILGTAREIVPRAHGLDRYQRLLVRLTVDGRRLQDIMVSEGLAVAYEGGRRINWCKRLNRA